MATFGVVETPRVADFSSIVDDLVVAGNVPAVRTDDATPWDDINIVKDDLVVGSSDTVGAADLVLDFAELGGVLVKTEGSLEVFVVT